MFITKKYLSRRTFLRGAGVTVGLPLLDAMIPAWTALAQTAASPKPHMGFMYLLTARSWISGRRWPKGRTSS